MTALRVAPLLALLAGGCSFGIDPESVPRPCVPSCENKVCDQDNGCGAPCVAGGAVKGCTRALHRVVNGRVGVGGELSTAAGGHSLRGRITFGAGKAAQVGGGGHEVSGVVTSP